MKRNFKISICTLILACCQNLSIAQQIIPCGTDIVRRELLEKFPELIEQERLNRQLLLESAMTKTGNNQTTYVIPIVFHVVHAYGPENVKDADIYRAVEVLNQDFGKNNPDINSVVAQFDTVATDMKIVFRLASLDPAGNCTNGIDRIYSQRTYNGDDSSKFNLWFPQRYLNIWLVNSLRDVSNGVLLGYSNFPTTIGSILNRVDGVIMRADALLGFDGRTLTHEIGHYLGLPHPWGFNNDVGATCGDDGVPDTPVTKGEFSTCRLNKAECTPGIVENIQNFMDYSNCSCMFTKGQRNLVHGSLNSTVAARNNLYAEETLRLTGTRDQDEHFPCKIIPDFSWDRQIICANDSNIRLSDQSWNSRVTSWSWEIQDGSPATSNDSTLRVKFNSPGEKNISLSVTNSTGTYRITKKIYVEGNMFEYYAPFTEQFDTQAPFGAFRTSNVHEAGANWEWVGNTGNNNPGAVKLNNMNKHKDKDYIITPPINFPINLSNPVFTFSFSAATTQSNGVSGLRDSIRIFYSTNCGDTWTQTGSTFNLFGAAVVTGGSWTSSYTPQSENFWRLYSVNLPPTLRGKKVTFMIRYSTNPNSNNFYIDDLGVGGILGMMEPEQLISECVVYPNPTQNDFTLRFSSPESFNGQLQMFSLDGKLVFEQNLFATAGENAYVIRATPEKGMYLLQIRGKTEAKIARLVVH